MSLSKIPVEVVEDHIFKYLAWHDLLRLRRVSKECLILVQDYVKTGKCIELAPELSVGRSSTGDYLDLETLTEINIPTTKIYFRNTNQHHQDEMKTFLEKYGGKVKHLRLQEFSIYRLRPDIVQLLEGLPSLESLFVGQFLIEHAPTQHFRPVLPPAVFQNLKVLDLHVDVLLTTYAGDLHRSLTIWLTRCRSLQKLRLSTEHVHVSASVLMRCVLEAIIVAVDSGGNHWESIEFDIDSKMVDHLFVEAFLRLLDTCAAKNVGVAGVRAEWLRLRNMHHPQQQDDWISSAITDLRLDEHLVGLRHLKLDKLTTLETKSALLFTETWDERQGQVGPWWSETLQTLILTLPSWEVNVGLLFQRLSGRQPLLALQEVSLKFVSSVRQKGATECLEQLIEIAPNLRELTLVKWSGSPFALARLLPRIRGLEKLSLVNCRRLEDEAFVGSDATNPVFLKLKNLRRLSLKNRRYPATGLTANCFANVFRHMSLTHFEMCAEPHMVEFRERCNWIKLLQEGPFAESIQEIKWNGCRLHQVPDDPELRELGKSFRSYNML